MADIQGRIVGNIGDNPVDLNTNGATEATLRLLLTSTLSANKQSLEEIKKLAKQLDLDLGNFKEFDANLEKSSGFLERNSALLDRFAVGVRLLTPVVTSVERALDHLSSNAARASDLFKDFGNLPVIGQLSQRYGKLLSFQEDNMKSYQQLTTAGVNFAGNLGDIRKAAGDAYLTLDQFSKLLLENRETLAMFGTGTNDGAVQFSKLAGAMQQSKVGENLRALGYTAEDLDAGMMTLIKNQGIRARGELQTKEQQDLLIQQTAEYLENLQGVSRLTGESKEEQQKKIDEVVQENAFQLHIAKLRAQGRGTQAEMEERAVADARVAGVGVMKNVQAAFLDTVSKDKGAVTLYSVAPGVMNTAMDAVKLAKQGLYSQTQSLQTQTDYALNAGKDMAQLPEALLLAINSTQDLGQYLNAVETLAVKTYGKTNEEITKILKPSATAGTQAEQMAKIQRDMFEASRKLNQATQQLVNDEMSFLANTIHKFAGTIGSLSDEVNVGNAGYINSMINTALGIVGIVGGISGFLNIKKELSLISNLSKAGGVPGGGGAVAESIAKKPGFLMTAEEKIAERSARMSAEKATIKATAAEGESVLSGLKKTASKLAKPLAGIGTALTVGLAVSDYADVEKARKQGKISAEEAKTKEGGIIGGAGGALGGAAVGALAGAAIGSVVPILGTAIGAGIGGIVGGFFGESVGKKAGESLATTDTTKAAAEEEARKKKQDEEKIKEAKVKTSEENLLEGVNRLNTTMDKILNVMRETAENTEKTAKEVNGNGWFQRKAH